MENFRQILVSWKDGHGGRFARAREDRIVQFVELFEEYKNQGYEIEFFTKSKMKDINDETINRGHDNSKKLKKWASINAEYLEAALYRVYDDDKDIEKSDLLESPNLDDVNTFEDEDEKESVEVIPDQRSNPDDYVSVASKDDNSTFDPEMIELLGLKIK